MNNTEIFKNDKSIINDIFNNYIEDKNRKTELDKLFKDSLRDHIIKYLDLNTNKTLNVEIQGDNFFVKYDKLKFEFWTVAKTTSKNYIPSCIITCFNRVLDKNKEINIGCKLREWKNYTVIGIDSIDTLIKYLDLIIDNLNSRIGNIKEDISIVDLDSNNKGLTVTTKNGVHTFKTDSKIRKNALKNAKYSCEVNKNHKSFITNDGNQYVEGHHLIPMKYQDYFNNSLDVEENIVSLCPNCHREIHYGIDRKRILESLYVNRLERLKKKGLNISLDDLLSYYSKLNISNSKI